MKLYNENCLDFLDRFISQGKEVDCIITSPPYNMNLRIRNGKHCSRQIVKELTTKYEGFDDNLPIEEYYQFNKAVLEKCLQISPLVFFNVQFLTGNKSALFRLIGEFSDKLKEFVVWDKVNAQPAISSGVMNSQFEAILIFDRDNAISRKFEKCNFNRGTLSNVWKIKRSKKIDKSHGAVFPTELVDMILTNFTSEGDIICDPFMGTGQTGISCKNLNRKFVGCELIESYFNLCKERLLND